MDIYVEALRTLCSREGKGVVAHKAGVSEANLSQILNGILLPSGQPRGVGPRLRKKLADAYPDWAQAGRLFNAEEIPVATSVPLISWVQAGAWTDVADPFAPGVADHWMPCPVKHGPNTYALRVRGESMFNPDGAPSYSEGDVIFVDPSRDARHGDRVVVRLEDQGEVTFKQLLVEDGRRLLKALNPAWTPRYIEINGNATIAGVVIGKWVAE